MPRAQSCGQPARGIREKNIIPLVRKQCFPDEMVYALDYVARKNELSVDEILLRNEILSEYVWRQLKLFELNLRFHLDSRISTFTNNQNWMQKTDLMLPQHINRASRRDDEYKAMSIGYLCLLFSNRYHNRLWVPCLQPSFPSWTASRRELHKTFKALVRVRNRIAHHEIIYNYPLIEIIDFAQQMLIDINPVAADEIRQRNYAKTINKIRLGSGGGI